MDKVIVLANDSGGLLHFRGELIARLSQQYEVICVVPNEDFREGLEEAGGKCIIVQMERRGTNPLKDIRLLFAYRRILKSTAPSIVLTYTIKPNVYGGIACKIAKIPYLSNVTGLGTTIENGGLLGYISLMMYRHGLSHASCVFFQNEHNMNLFVKKKIVRGATELIPGSGVNVDKHVYEEYPIDDGIMRFLFVGRVMKDKGIGELLAATEKMAGEGKKVFLDVVGRCEEDYLEQLKEYEKKGILKYNGVQKDVHPFYARAHCVVLPSYHEGMANVILEASSTGRPIITCRIPGCQETFDEGITGYGCEPKDSDSLKEAMDKMYGTPWEKRKQMGVQARDKVKRQFDRNIIIQAYMKRIEMAKR